jgi:integrase
VILRSGSFYIRYYTSGAKRVTKFLCEQDAKHPNTQSRAVRHLATKFMEPINAAGGDRRHRGDNTLVSNFWDTVYLPWCRDNLRSHTVKFYVQTWNLYMVDHFKDRTLAEYRPSDASELLTHAAKTGRRGNGLGRSTVGHIRSIGSGIFGHAVKTGIIDRNPWSEAGVLTKLKANIPTHAYTIEEAKAILAALASRLDAWCVFGFAFFLGCRPSEIAGLRWKDITEGVLYVQRAAVLGVVDDTKTHSSKRYLGIIEPLRSMLETWHHQCGDPEAGYIFPRANGGPLNVESLVSHCIKPLCEAAGVSWRGLYSARRGHGTVMTRLSSLTAARQTLGHSTEVTTAKHYALPDRIAGDAGLKVLEAKFNATDTNSDTKPTS